MRCGLSVHCAAASSLVADVEEWSVAWYSTARRTVMKMRSSSYSLAMMGIISTVQTPAFRGFTIYVADTMNLLARIASVRVWRAPILTTQSRDATFSKESVHTASLQIDLHRTTVKRRESLFHIGMVSSRRESYDIMLQAMSTSETCVAL